MTERLPPEGHLERDPATLFRWLVDGVLILAAGAEEPLQITAPGDIVWELLAEPLTADGLAGEVGTIFGTSIDVVQADVDQLLAALWRVQAIRVATKP